MSVRIMSKVWELYPNGGGEMLLALALADHAHDDGTRIYPSVSQLAAKTRQSVRTVQYQLRNMEAAAWLLLCNAGNGGRNTHREYRINPAWLNGADFASLAGDESDGGNGAEIAPGQKGANGDEKGATDDAKGAIAGAPASNRHKPSKNHQSARGTRLPDDWELKPETLQWTLAKTAAYAENLPQWKGGAWSAEHTMFEAEKFKDYWIGVSGQSGVKTDWPGTWRNWVRKAGPMQGGGGARKPGGNAGWWVSYDAALAKAQEVGVGAPHAGESEHSWHGRIRAAIDNGGRPPEPSRPAQAVTIRDPGAEPEGKAKVSPENRAAFLEAARQLQARGLPTDPNAGAQP
ncbi:helix-turn-helix domain-containing protein [Cupriavidus sp. Marseille-Q8015]